MACFERDGEIGIDGYSLFDWDWDFAGYGAAGGREADVAGGDFVDFGGGYFFVADTCGVDWVVGCQRCRGSNRWRSKDRRYKGRVKGDGEKLPQRRRESGRDPSACQKQDRRPQDDDAHRIVRERQKI